MNRIEPLFYELRPYLFLSMGVYLLSATLLPSAVGVGSVLLLMFCSALIIHYRMQARRGTTIEQVFYDLQPVLYFCLAAYALVWHHHSRLASTCAMILLVCASLITHWRMARR